ncbi:glycoside hydrolase/phage tail family protein [Pseudoroseicyclus sp. CXY001]|uniref:baseplate multidomain protein megatron n=1 Tax=Pseudoroseicyclus sp. CXY001 TaxID=3242492 RepID=UPI0035709ECC
MATLLLSAAGAAIGGSVGGTVLGLSAATIGQAVGATAGRLIDERLLGGSAPAPTGRIDRFRVTGASLGAPIGQVHGRMRIGGQVIWASRFLETEVAGETGGKGGNRAAPEGYAYTVSLAVALCEGPITHVGRIWADGEEVDRTTLTIRTYLGDEAQGPDPKIAAVEGAAPAYRGTAYVVFEDLPLGPYGNRVPQFSFEVFRPGPPSEADDFARLTTGVALIPGTGEYALATSPVWLGGDYGEARPVNLSTAGGGTDFSASLEALTGELPALKSVSLVVSWFGDDLRCGQCSIRPKVEQTGEDAEAMPWTVGPLTRAEALEVPKKDGSPVYGGTPCDASVIEAITALKAAGVEVMYYPFILMDQMAGNSLPDPYSAETGQAVLPWRGRITLSEAPGRPGSPDGTGTAEAQVAAFFGSATAADFGLAGGEVSYTGDPEDWGFNRYILHQAMLCVAAGGVDAFCIGSEMVGLTTIRGPGHSFPAVTRLIALAAEVRTILGAGTELTYAADWSEYFGYQPAGTADRYFHLDPLWMDPNIDFIGIDNYMPLSDWRDGESHADAGAGSIYDLDYLEANVSGGELYDWYYASEADRAAQLRTPVTDGEAEPWVWRPKDLRSWWSTLHYERIEGVRQAQPNLWQPRAKQIRFTELGCAAVDKGTNQPNKFRDPKSSESAIPYFSDGRRDEYIQLQYLRAHDRHWRNPANNPVSHIYGGPMVDWSRAHVWAWDARPFPAFPQRGDLWTDGGNYARGHWLTGRSSARPLSAVVREICARAGVTEVDTSRLHGLVRGYHIGEETTARAALQVLMLAYGFDAVERGGTLAFITRTGTGAVELDPERFVFDPEAEASREDIRLGEAERLGRVRLGFIEGEGDYQAGAAEAVFADDPSLNAAESELPLALTRGEARNMAERWLAEARLTRERVSFALPPSVTGLGPGDVVKLGPRRFRLDRLEDVGFLRAEAQRIEPESYRGQEAADDLPGSAAPVVPVPVEGLVLDLPLLTGGESPQSPYIATCARPWPGHIAVHVGEGDAFGPAQILRRPAFIGRLVTPLAAAAPGRWDRAAPVRVKLVNGQLSSVTERALLSGANLAAIGSGHGAGWEVIQFRDAVLSGPRTYDLGLRLRGQAGTEGEIPEVWPEGSFFVLLDGRPEQLPMTLAERGLTRSYRWGPAAKPLDHASYRETDLSVSGLGLRPYAPCQLRARPGAGGATEITWIRRARVGGDPWEAEEIPLGEAYERYRVRIRLLTGGDPVRIAEVTTPAFTYGAAAQAADGAGAGYQVEVQQKSDLWGWGPAAKLVP